MLRRLCAAAEEEEEEDDGSDPVHLSTFRLELSTAEMFIVVNIFQPKASILTLSNTYNHTSPNGEKTGKRTNKEVSISYVCVGKEWDQLYIPD